MKNRLRNNRGSMLSMTILVICIMLFACIVGFGLYLMFAEQKRGQHKADQLAMTMASELNMGDKLGQMNFTVIRSRELVYQSREMSNYTSGGWMSFCSPLADQLLQEAQTGANLVEEERKNQIKLTKKKLLAIVTDYNKNVSSEAELSLPGWRTYQPQIVEVRLGSIKGVKSNVEHNEIYEDLLWEDQRQKLYDEKSMLYVGNVNAKLPSPDLTIPFKISSLPATVEKTISPARLVNPEVFQYKGSIYAAGEDTGAKLDQLSSALQLIEQVPITLKSQQQAVQVGATAATNGGAPEPGI